MKGDTYVLLIHTLNGQAASSRLHILGRQEKKNPKKIIEIVFYTIKHAHDVYNYNINNNNNNNWQNNNYTTIFLFNSF